MMYPYIDNYFMFYPRIPAICDMPPTLYSILESIVNYGKDEKTKIKDLAKVGRTTIFDFDYTLTDNISKEDFECMILNHFLMRRIGFETVTAFKIQLNVKINEIIPIYNKMFDAIENWNILNDGEITTKTGTDNRTSNNTSSASNQITNNSTSSDTNISDRRNSELPQNQLSELRDGNYVTNYNYDTNTNNAQDSSTSTGSSTSTNNGTDSNTYNETITRTPNDKIAIYKEFQENIKSIYGMIFKDLECLFYQLL